MLYRNRNIAAIFKAMRLKLRLVRGLQMAGGYQACLIHRARDSLQIGRLQVLNRGLHLDVEVLHWSKLVEIWGTQNEKKNDPQLNVCPSLVDSYNSSQATTAPEIQGRS